MTAGVASKLRILVGASSFADATTALRIAQRVAQDFAQCLGGLLVDDENTRVVCELPNQRVISARGAFLLSPSPSQMHTLMNADARAFEHLIEKIAHPAALDWSFDRQMGELIDTAMRTAGGWDVVIFGYRSIHPFTGKIVAIEPTLPDDGKLMDLSRQLAGQLNSNLVLFRVGAETAIDLHAQHHTSLVFDSPEEAIAALDRTNAQAVVVDLSCGPIHSKAQLKSLVDASRCPVVVLGASSWVPKVEHTTHFPPV
ncbi:replication initiator protein A [Roseobacter weihaiensis]|uniref:replication initiator protein A n=1 Tax=Roseobacter weihaiensis TaxID=2763262 RepID=UPI001D09D5FC|nr:replication initiator protein A [Roseobacter sp. H9]